jgi:hypothetical protein
MATLLILLTSSDTQSKDMLRERNTFVLTARSGRDKRPHSFTLNVYVRAQDLGHFNARGAKAVEVSGVFFLLLGRCAAVPTMRCSPVPAAVDGAGR